EEENFSNIIVPSPAQHQHQSPQQQQKQISQCLPSSSHYHQQHLMNFTSPVEFNKLINATDHHGRSSHLPNSLMSNISSLSSSASSQAGSLNRRVPRCTSPRTCMWPSYNLASAPNTDRQHFTQLPGPSNTDVRNTGVCPQLGVLSTNSLPGPSNTDVRNTGLCPQLGVLSTNSVSSTCSPNQNSSQFSHSRNRLIAGHLQTVAAHFLGSVVAAPGAAAVGGAGSTSYPRDKGRHRSGTMSGGGGGGATSKSVLLGGRLPGICQNMPSHKSNVVWDNFESETNTNLLEKQQEYFSSNWPWSPPMDTGVGEISETDTDISNFLDHCQMPLVGSGGVSNSSSIGIRDDTSRDSGLVLDMTMPPTS
ncbi:unnamed protein product, partial [Trichobilharzia regenti]